MTSKNLLTVIIHGGKKSQNWNNVCFLNVKENREILFMSWKWVFGKCKFFFSNCKIFTPYAIIVA